MKSMKSITAVQAFFSSCLSSKAMYLRETSPPVKREAALFPPAGGKSGGIKKFTVAAPLKIFAIFVLNAASPPVPALSNSLTDPDLAVRRQKSSALEGFLGLRFARNLRVPGEMKNLMNPEHENSLQKGNIIGDISFSYSFKPLSLGIVGFTTSNSEVFFSPLFSVCELGLPERDGSHEG